MKLYVLSFSSNCSVAVSHTTSNTFQASIFQTVPHMRIRVGIKIRDFASSTVQRSCITCPLFKGFGDHASHIHMFCPLPVIHSPRKWKRFQSVPKTLYFQVTMDCLFLKVEDYSILGVKKLLCSKL
ncbi:unnamed protein product [Prunus armeniaca]|uniref:Uncharacterized protein n=1 Tax=Prunus armeniaca TaxID=36596 RepID=A0A6J5W3S8_PRUAR|nr:unnamed protein product [Prunus armeniaca]CAB4294517.1 unnamed protein product [Prunus armeniaca]